MGIKTHSLLENGSKLPLVVEPDESSQDSLTELKDWLKAQNGSLDKTITENGAILFKNFHIQGPQEFEDIALLIDPDLKNNYLGTSPRNAVTKYVFSASELPGYYPIMQHCEMSFLEGAPRKLFFFCNIEPEDGTGQTPICDFRKVYKDLDPKIREEFETKGVRYIRNYSPPDHQSRFNLWQLKGWDAMFQTKDEKKAEEIAKEHKLEVTWKGKGHLMLTNSKDAVINHPITGEKVWFNHLQVFHRDAAKIEYGHIAGYQKSLRSGMYKNVVGFMSFLKDLTTKDGDEPMHVRFGDDTEIPTSYVRHVEEIIWKNLVIFPWRKGDMIAIDNFSTSHGRLPYKGPREILVCWSSDN